VAVRDIFVSGDGVDTADGTTWNTRVRTFTRARALASGVSAPDTVRFVIGQFVMARQANFGQQLGKGIGTNSNVPDGWSMTARDPNLPWHFTDLDVLNQPSDFVQVFLSGASDYNANTAGCPNIRNNGGTNAGQPTGIWVTTRNVAGVNQPQYRVIRVWRGGRPLTIGSLTAVPSAYDPYNEIWEARSFATLGLDDTHTWTQLTPPEVWQEDDDPDPVPTPIGGRLFVFSPKGNPASSTVWGGITLLTQWSAGATGVLDLGLLTIQESSDWHVDETIKAVGGGYGAFKIRGGCARGRFEARVDVMTPYQPVVDLRAHSAADTFTAIEVSPRWDMRVVGKPYYEIDNAHGTGASDALRIAGNARVTGLLIRGRTSGTGELCYVRDPGHTAIGRANPGAGVILDGLTVERDFSVYLGGMQYQRAFGINGDSNRVRNCTLSGRVYGQRTPSQITGNVRVVGLEFHYGQQMIPASPDGVANYPSRFNDGERPFANAHPDGKNRDCVGLVVAIDGTIELRDCVFNAVHGPGLRVGASVVPDLAAGDDCLVENCTFINSAVPASQRTAVLVDVRNDAAKAVRLRNNGAVGYAAGGQWTTTGFNRNTVRLEDLHLPQPGGPKVAENVGWQRLAFANCFG
jgi:hypothetical protein